MPFKKGDYVYHQNSTMWPGRHQVTGVHKSNYGTTYSLKSADGRMQINPSSSFRHFEDQLTKVDSDDVPRASRRKRSGQDCRMTGKKKKSGQDDALLGRHGHPVGGHAGRGCC